MNLTRDKLRTLIMALDAFKPMVAQMPQGEAQREMVQALREEILAELDQAPPQLEFIQRENAFALYKAIEARTIDVLLKLCWEQAQTIARRAGGDESSALELYETMRRDLEKERDKMTREAFDAFFAPQDKDNQERETP